MHPGWMRHVIVTAVEQDPEIAAFVRHDVEQVEKTGGTFTIHGTNEDGAWKSAADVVVNCLWEGRHRIDRALRPHRTSDWITRVKYGFMLDSAPGSRTCRR